MHKPPPKSSQDFYAAFSTVSSPDYPGNKPTAAAAPPAKAAPAAAAPPAKPAPAAAPPAKAAPAKAVAPTPAPKAAPAAGVQKPAGKPASTDFYAAFGTVSSPDYPGNKPAEAAHSEPAKPPPKAAEPAKPAAAAAPAAPAGVKKPAGKPASSDFYAAFGTVSSPEYPGNKPAENAAPEPAKPPAKAESAKPPAKAEPAKPAAPPKAEPAKPAAAPAADKAARVCAGCEQPIKGTVVKALNKEWHKQCFVCSKCSGPFVGGTFAVKGGKPLCTNCSGK